MLNAQQNERLVRVGAGTPMGNALRRFWLPVCQVKDLAIGGAPYPVRLLGEDLLAFQKPGGDFGLVDRFCAHRGADLLYARNDENGLRCIFHGWQYDVSGQCIEIPNVSEGPRICSKVKLKSYPALSKGGLLWAYMGPEDQRPPLPNVPWLDKGTDHWSNSFIQVECEGNFFQHIEGLCDGSHVGFLHANLQGGGGGGTRFDASPAFLDKTPKWVYLEHTEYGAALGLERDAGAGKRNVRINQFVLPFSVQVPTPKPFNVASWQTNVPIDDDHTMYFYTAWYDPAPLKELQAAVGDRSYVPPELIPGTYKPVMNRANRYLQDRGAFMREESFSGIRNLRVEDLAVAEYVRGGLVADRSMEMLVSSDRAVGRVRARMLDLVDKLEVEGNLRAETQALASTRVVPSELDLSVNDDIAACCRTAGITTVD